jgi:hypothetical protein
MPITHLAAKWSRDRQSVQFALLTEDLDYLDKAEQTLAGVSGKAHAGIADCIVLVCLSPWIGFLQLYVKSIGSAEQIAILETQYLPTAVLCENPISPGRSRRSVHVRHLVAEPARSLGAKLRFSYSKA